MKERNMRSNSLQPILKTSCLIALAIVLSSGCTPKETAPKDFSIETWENYGPENPNPALTLYEMPNGQPSHITVQHILIRYAGNAEKEKDKRSTDESRELAMEVLKKAEAGEDFDELVVTYTEDSAPGIHRMANHGVQVPQDTGSRKSRVSGRGQMVVAFGDTGFDLKVGEIGITKEGKGSPFGWHIIKRLK